MKPGARAELTTAPHDMASMSASEFAMMDLDEFKDHLRAIDSAAQSSPGDQSSSSAPTSSNDVPSAGDSTKKRMCTTLPDSVTLLLCSGKVDPVA